MWPIMTCQPLFFLFRQDLQACKIPVSQIRRCVTENTLLKDEWVLQPLATPELFNSFSVILPPSTNSLLHPLSEHLGRAYQVQDSVLGSMGDTSLSGPSCYSQNLLYHYFLPLWLISKFLLRVVPAGCYPWRMVELCEMFQAILSRNIPLNLSVFIRRTLRTVLIICSPARMDGGSSVDCLPISFIWRQTLGDEQFHSVLTVVFAMAAGDWCFCFPTK